MSRKKSLSGDPRWCHICGLRIPDTVVSSDHPLFGTIDHVHPLSVGGKNIYSNRKPSHRYCNNKKGSEQLPLRKEVICGLQGTVVIHLRRLGLIKLATDNQIRQARRRIGLNHPTKLERQEYSLESGHNYHRWCDDGGFCLTMETDLELDPVTNVEYLQTQ